MHVVFDGEPAADRIDVVTPASWRERSNGQIRPQKEATAAMTLLLQ